MKIETEFNLGDKVEVDCSAADGGVLMKKWIEMIAEHIAQRERISVDDIFTVWSCKTLQNRKAIFGCTRDQQLWEATYNGDKDETYIDRYQKFSNWVLKEVAND